MIGSVRASAEDLNLLATSSANVNSGTAGGQSISQRSFIQSLDMNYNRSVSPLLSYRLRLRGLDDESSSSSAGSRTTSSSRFVEPEADLTLSGLRYSLDAGGRFRETFNSTSQSSPLRVTEDHEFIRAFFTPDLLPEFNFQLERTAATDDQTPRGLDREEIRAIFGATYTLAQKVNLAYTFTNQTTDDTAAGRKQDQRSHVGTASYADGFWRDRIAVNANYLITRLDTTERLSPTAVGGVVAVPVVLNNAFSLPERDATVAAVNKTPPDPTTYQNQSTGTSTALTFSVPLTVNGGTTQNLNQSIAVGLTPGTSVTTVRLTVTGRAGDLRDISLQAAGVVFQVFVGAVPLINQTAWTLVPSSATLPTSLNPFFEISFAATSGNFLKIHVASDSQQLTGLDFLTATQIEVFRPAAAGAGNRVTTGNLLQLVAGGLVAQPIEALTLNGNATYSTNSQDPSGRRDDTATYSVIATGTPHRLLTATGVYQATFTTSNDPQTPRTDARIASLTLSSTPLPTLTASLIGSRNEDETGGVLQDRTDSIGFNTALKPYRNLNVDFTATGSQSDNFVDDSRTRALTTALNANATLTPRLTGLFGYGFGVNEVTGGPTPSSTTTNVGFLSFTYTVSRFLNATGRWDFTASEGTYTVGQQYRLDLIPTLKTSVFLTYLRTDQFTGTGTTNTNSLTLTGRWNISRYLDLNMTGSFTRGATGDTVYSLFTTLAFRL
ncbi:MAG TPA: hypothetical protein VLT62_14495 [Candidatus Methylomirabilis sp.]|nr:hypothetical protein [Candidatus Methylomirabilis sp.]